MKELYEAIVTRLTAEVSALKEIDLEMGQLEILALGEKPIVLFPCALIDISYPLCEDENADIQMVTASVNIRIAFECPLPTDNLASTARRTAALNLFSIVDSVYTALQGYSTTEFGTFSRKRMSPDNRFAGIKIINLLFETNFEEV
jgi:hypothetical protein